MAGRVDVWVRSALFPSHRILPPAPACPLRGVGWTGAVHRVGEGRGAEPGIKSGRRK